MDFHSLKSGFWQGLGGILGKMRVRFDKALTKKQGNQIWIAQRARTHIGHKDILATGKSLLFRPPSNPGWELLTMNHLLGMMERREQILLGWVEEGRQEELWAGSQMLLIVP